MIRQARENPLVESTLEYYNRGLCILPIPYGKKVAMDAWKRFQDARPNEKTVLSWIDKFRSKKANIAVILGEVSGGLACRDFDTMAEYEKWAAAYPDLAKILPTVKTARGMHVYFEGHIEGIKHIVNGELRGSRCYCLLPPSIHPDGTEYKWVIPFSDNLICVDPKLAGFIPIGTEQSEQSEKPEYSEQSEHSEAIEGEGIENLISATLPKEFGTRNRKIFELARWIKSLPQYAESDPTEFRNVVKQWHTLALPNIRTKEFYETWCDFLVAWGKVKYPKGKEPMALLFQRAVSGMIKPPESIVKLYPESTKIQALAAVCRELQKEAGNAPFYVSVRTAAGYLNVDKKTATKYLYLLRMEKIIKEVEKGGTIKTPRKASRYKFIF